MASYIELTLDTTAPGGVSVIINNGERETDLYSVSLAIACSDADLIGYQMKIWGIVGTETEDSAAWEKLYPTKDVTLPKGDGEKTVYVKIRDDVLNESVTASATIGLYTTLPTVKVTNIGRSKLSRMLAPAVFCLDFSEKIDALKILIVENVNASYDDASNIAIPATKSNSLIMIETPDDTEFLQSDYMEFTDIAIDSNIELTVNLNIDDILSVLPGDGVKILKAFVRSASSGKWSK